MIREFNGNLFNSNAQIICHQCNCRGVMGSGIAAEVKRRYPVVYRAYRAHYMIGGLELGQVLFVHLGPPSHQIIANLLAQDGYGKGKQFTDYEALRKCLIRIKFYNHTQCNGEIKSIAFPYGMGSVRGGGDWNKVYKIIEEELDNYDVEIWKL